MPPDGQTLFGVQLSWDVDTPVSYGSRLGLRPAEYGDFVAFPLTAASKVQLANRAAQVSASGADFFLTLEPLGGLSVVTGATARDLAQTLAAINARGPHFYIRFAQEMNGGWYPWGQQPAAYVSAFRLLAAAVHRDAPGNAMVWSPNYGGGYPFSGGPYVARTGTTDFAALDTNHDGVLTMSDDSYGPFYPGDASVDWVGLTLYWFGYQWPWGDNEVPDPGRFSGSLTGTYDGAQDERGVPDFYRTYAVGHHKPLVVSETAALYNTSNPTGATEVAIKSAWMDQALNPANTTQFPALKMLNWFEHEKSEQEDYGIIDWRATADDGVRTALVSHLTASSGQFLFATR